MVEAYSRTCMFISSSVLGFLLIGRKKPRYCDNCSICVIVHNAVTSQVVWVKTFMLLITKERWLSGAVLLFLILLKRKNHE